MESIENSYMSLSKQQIISSEEVSLNYDSMNLDFSSNINLSHAKDISIQNFVSLEKDLKVLSQEVLKLRQKNKVLQSSLQVALHEKEIHIENHAKEVAKLTKINKKLQEELESERKRFRKEFEKVKIELDKNKKAFKQLASSSEARIKETHKDGAQLKQKHEEEMEKKNREISELISRIRAIESHVSKYKTFSSPSSQIASPKYFKNSQNSEVGRLPSYSMDELSELIVDLEKSQAQLKEKMLGTSKSESKVITGEIALNNMKLDEIREVQKKLIRSRGKLNN